MRVIIACAGSQDKWSEFLGVPSHLVPVPVDGPAPAPTEPLLCRTIRQALRHTDNVLVTVPEHERLRYSLVVPAERLRSPGPAPSEFASTRDLWATEGRTVLLLGDVYFTDAALARVAGFRDPRPQLFGRAGASGTTGTPYGELFASSWWPQHRELLDRHLVRVHQARAAGNTRPPGWLLLRSLQATPLERHIVKRGRFFTKLDDATDDFDFPIDYARHPATRGLAESGGGEHGQRLYRVP